MKRVILSPKMVSHFEIIFGFSITRFMLIVNLQESSLSFYIGNLFTWFVGELNICIYIMMTKVANDAPGRL